MNKYLAIVLVLFCTMASAAEKRIEGRLEYINQKTARIDGVSYNFSSVITKCFTEGLKRSCNNVLGVGYADKVVVILNSENYITQLDVLKQNQ